MRLRPVLRGLATFVPVLGQFLKERKGGADTARYCYSAWLRHLVMAQNSGLSTRPQVVAELGPGYSIGIGLAGLISGASRYYALDIVEFAGTERNLHIFDDLLSLFSAREDIPGEDEFPEVKPYLTSYEFPSNILSDARLEAAMKHGCPV